TPLVVMVDDAHAADEPSLALLAEVGRSLGGAPCMLVLSGRPELADRLRAGAEGETRIELGGLAALPARRLYARFAAPVEGVPAGFVDRLIARTYGVPGLGERALGGLVGAGVVTVSPTGFAADPARAATYEPALSDAEEVELRLGALSPSEREVAERAAAC